MKPTSFSIAIAGGGSTYTTGIIQALLTRLDDFPVKRIALYDIDSERQSKVAALASLILRDARADIELIHTTDPETAFSGVQFVFAQIRAGGMKMREQDEKIPLRLGCVGQETCGAGGFAYGMRSIGAMIELVRLVEAQSPEAWILNYSNPASIVAEALRRACPNSRVLNICDMPISIEAAIAEALGISHKDLEPDYFGLNHFGWWQRLRHRHTGEDLLPRVREMILETGVKPANQEMADTSWFSTYQMLTDMMTDFPQYLPNTYLQYYLYPDKVVAKSNPEFTRANEVMAGRETRIFAGADRAIRENSLENVDLSFDVHGEYIIDVAQSIAFNQHRRFLVIVENRGSIPNFRDDAMVEIPVYLGSCGPEPIRFKDNIPDFQKGLMENQAAAEKLLVDAFFEQSYSKALQAFTLNRTIPSAVTARKVLDALIEANRDFWPELKR